MMTMLLPEFVQCITFSFFNDKVAVTNFKTFFFEFFDNFWFSVFLIDGEVTFSFMESDVWWEDILSFQQCFLDVFEWDGLLFFDTKSEDDSEIKGVITVRFYRRGCLMVCFILRIWLSFWVWIRGDHRELFFWSWFDLDWVRVDHHFVRHRRFVVLCWHRVFWFCCSWGRVTTWWNNPWVSELVLIGGDFLIEELVMS